ncbi:class I SAM-dependent methyltransferase [Luedemannella helvata]|uniref:class I SAM-dependent methyltransferase n=1 Tax=Luedemannella helvata TaxID=349315 RepID=UPI0031DBAB93
MTDPGFRYDEVLDRLRTAYDGGAAMRDAEIKAGWKIVERAAFLARLREAGAARLLEIGAGTGQDSVFFRDNGLTVVATDLSPQMVARCRAKGLDAHVRDFLHLGFEPASFDAVYAVNCLLHVPTADLPTVLGAIRDVLVPGGLFFLGAYGGLGEEGIVDWDKHEPHRFFAWRSEEQMVEAARGYFEVVDSHRVPMADHEHHFHSLTLRRPAG